MSNTSKAVAASVGLLLMVLIISRQLFLFIGFRDTQGFLDSQGGRYHLWISLIAASIACIAGVLMFYFFGQQGRNESSQPERARSGSLKTVSNEYSNANAPARVPFDNSQWSQLNPWLSEGQSDDRRPIDGSVAASRGTQSGQRSFARESHQLRFKKWSQERRD